MSGFRQQPKGFATKAIHVGQDPEQWSHQSVIPPIVLSTTFKQPAPAEPIVSKVVLKKNRKKVKILQRRHENFLPIVR